MKAYTNVSRKTVGEDRVAICPSFGCEFMSRVKPLKFGFLGFGKYPKCKKHRIPLVYVNERIGDFVDAALACFFDKSGLPPNQLLESVKTKFPNEINSFVEGWVYCITVGRGAPIVSRYMDTISNGYLKQLTKKQIKVLKNGTGSKPNIVNKAIMEGIDEIGIQSLFFDNCKTSIYKLTEITEKLSMLLHYFSEESLHTHPKFLKFSVTLAQHLCLVKKCLNARFSEFFEELEINYNNLEVELEDLIEVTPIKKKQSKKQLEEKLTS